MVHWLLKTEPETYSYDDLVRDGQTPWDGVRNFLARNNLQAMRPGDLGFLYHSVGPREIVGLVEVVSVAYPDATSDDPRWVCVDVKPKGRLPRALGLDEIKRHPLLQGMEFVRMSRLSVSPVKEEEWREVLRVTEGPPEAYTDDDGASLARQASTPSSTGGGRKVALPAEGPARVRSSSGNKPASKTMTKGTSAPRMSAKQKAKAGAPLNKRGRGRAT